MKIETKLDKPFYILGWILLSALLIVFALEHLAPQKEILLGRPCIFHEVAGYYCPGCGGTRAAYWLINGHIIKSFLYHPVVLYAAVTGGWFMISQTIDRICQKVKRTPFRFVMHMRMVYIYILLILLAVNWVVKNLVIIVTGYHIMG